MRADLLIYRFPIKFQTMLHRQQWKTYHLPNWS